MAAPDFALEHYAVRAELAHAASAAMAEMWAQVDPGDIVGSWTAQIPEAAIVTTGGQLTAARTAEAYVAEAAAFAEAAGGAAAAVRAAGFAGIASDARDLISLLYQPAVASLLAIKAGADARTALATGRATLDMIVRTQVADAGRLADQAALTARKGLDGYVRVVVGATCARCIVLAGKTYRWNTGFKRHPHCDCQHLPTHLADNARIKQDPQVIYNSLTPAERRAAGWTLADQKALAEGADMNQVVNARRGLYTAGERRYTSEGTTRRALYGGYEIDPETGKLTKLPRGQKKRAPRLSVDQIFIEAGDDRNKAIRLLRQYGYLVG